MKTPAKTGIDQEFEMRMTQRFPKRTQREASGDMRAAHALLVRGGYIDQVAPGIHNLLPDGWRVVRRLEEIIFEEMERDGVHNLLLPILQPKELWDRTGRWDGYDRSKTMFQTLERHTGALFGLAPTAEEVVTDLAARMIQSHADLPFSLHQIGPKFRDEIRPRLGLLRGREFSMSDAYSFAADPEGMNDHFDQFQRIYERIFARVGLTRCVAVRADSGAIGGSGSSEFMALSEDVGEDTLLTCASCGYGANAEKANSHYAVHETRSNNGDERQDIETPGIKTVEQLEEFFAEQEITARDMVKTIVLSVDPEGDDTYEAAVCIRGDLSINLVKVRNALGAEEVVAAAGSVVEEATGAEVGFAGPLGLLERGFVRRILFDVSTEPLNGFLCGLNTTDVHAINVVWNRDVARPERYHELHTAEAGHGCPECDGTLDTIRGIEVGHIFKLQQGYAKNMGCTFTDTDGNEQTVWMGCYGIGVTRLAQAIVDQNHDDKGIIWPESVAPWKAVIVPANWSNETQRTLATRLYDRLSGARIPVVLDDREERMGMKLTDAELLGFPWVIVVGREAKNDLVEVRRRDGGIPTTNLGIEDLMAAWAWDGCHAWRLGTPGGLSLFPGQQLKDPREGSGRG